MTTDIGPTEEFKILLNYIYIYIYIILKFLHFILTFTSYTAKQ